MGPDAVVLSRFDDAVLSCWHLLASAGEVLVVNVFAGEPPAGALGWWDRLAGATDSAAVVRTRIEEDRQALALAGRTAVNLPFLDSQHRQPDQASGEIVEALREVLVAGARVYAPASLGDHHRDHTAVRGAAGAPPRGRSRSAVRRPAPRHPVWMAPVGAQWRVIRRCGSSRRAMSESARGHRHPSRAHGGRCAPAANGGECRQAQGGAHLPQSDSAAAAGLRIVAGRSSAARLRGRSATAANGVASTTGGRLPRARARGKARRSSRQRCLAPQSARANINTSTTTLDGYEAQVSGNASRSSIRACTSTENRDGRDCPASIAGWPGFTGGTIAVTRHRRECSHLLGLGSGARARLASVHGSRRTSAAHRHASLAEVAREFLASAVICRAGSIAQQLAEHCYPTRAQRDVAVKQRREVTYLLSVGEQRIPPPDRGPALLGAMRGLEQPVEPLGDERPSTRCGQPCGARRKLRRAGGVGTSDQLPVKRTRT